MPLTTLFVVNDFKKERKAQIYTWVHPHAFGHDPTDMEVEVMLWLKSQSCAYNYGRSFLRVDCETEMKLNSYRISQN